ncbi:MAG: DUF2750 domain-containing protein [Cytophagales bacterium]|nr:DUF2750 domain-containing protein [Cytophagales bacterium]
MDNYSEEAEKRYKLFVNQVVDNGFLWGLTNTRRWATSSSSFFKKVEAMPFWSSDKDAIACAKDAWKDYHASKILLGEFLENWCAGLYEDRFLVGLNWLEDLSGKEMEPLDLMLEIIEELKIKGKSVQLNNYEGLDDLETEVRSLLEDES